MSRTLNHGLLRRRAGLLLVALTVAVTGVVPAAGASSDHSGRSEVGRFREVGQVPIPESDYGKSSGWLVLSPLSRRGYSFTEGALDGNATDRSATIIESFDLDTLNVLRRVVIPGIPIPSGEGSERRGQTSLSGDIVHAVDAEAGRVYVPMSKDIVPVYRAGPDAQRPVNFVLVIDDKSFDRDPNTGFGYFTFAGLQQRFAEYPLLGLGVSRHHVRKDEPGKLLAVFAAITPVADAFNVGRTAIRPRALYDHTLVQWDPSDVATGRSAPPPHFQPGSFPAAPLTAEWEQVLAPCATVPMTSGGTEQVPSGYSQNFQREFVAAAAGVFVPCQSAPGSGAVVRVPLGATGRPVPGAAMQLVSLGKPVGDALADPAGGRLYLRSFGGGATWWAFDTHTMRFVGSIAAHLVDVRPMAAGIDPGTGRLYTLTPDTCAPRQGGGALPFRGGLKIADARLEPVPAQENIRPDLAYNSWWRIHVDPVARRVFVRRGVSLEGSQLQYPECDPRSRVDAPQEFFYRVFEDRIPVATQPGELDDAPFTTNVPEKEGITQASFLGSGTGYGSRVVLTGGLAAATEGASDMGDNRRSPCSRDDRELLAGSVGRVEVSDQSTSADAASLDGDARTQEHLGYPLNQCRPQPSPDDPQPPPAARRCHAAADSDELAFDEAFQGQDGNGDGCNDRKGKNVYAVECNGDQDPEAVAGPSSRKVPRDGFAADVACKPTEETADGHAEGALSSDVVDRFQQGLPEGQLREPFRVGRSRSEVAVTRRIGKGITVEVDSWARAVELPGLGTIGAVRVEATSTATGRDGRARGTFKRTICDVRMAGVVVSGCLGDADQQASLAKRLTEALGGRGEVRLRHPDERLLEGTEHGYLAAVQRDRKQLFGDQTIARDRSLAVPGLEIVLSQGDGGVWGAGRQILQLAGAQASTSYGIVCIYGQASSGRCNDENDADEGPVFPAASDDGTATITEVERIREASSPPGDDDDEPAIIRLVKRIPQAIAEALRLLFNNPRELGLLAAVWGLLYAPCYLGERRRSIEALASRRAVGSVS